MAPPGEWRAAPGRGGFGAARKSEYIMRNAGLEETQAGIKIARRNINNLRYADDTTLMAERLSKGKPLSEENTPLEETDGNKGISKGYAPQRTKMILERYEM
ncbi:hypothetical protein CapIbe_021575 [Capra ibex]